VKSAVLLVLAACGGADDLDDLDCEYLASAENCWKTTTSAAVSCLPPANETGVLAADNASCTYATGQVITFDPPLVLPFASSPQWNFTIVTNGQPCLHYEDREDGFDLTVGNETVSERLEGRGLELSCPDGTTVSSSNALELLSCPDSNFGDLPGTTSSSGATSVRFGLLNTGMDTLDVFDCSR